jgi:hypothetical protein
VRTCRDPGAFWTYIKAKHSGTGGWAARREHIRAGFEPLFLALERFDDSPIEPLLRGEVVELDSASVTAAWERALERRQRDPAGAITAARTLLESVCKTILDDVATDPNDHYDGDDLPQLYSRVAKLVNLAPSDHTEKAFKQILGGCFSVVNGLANVRNRAGDSHGEGRRSYRPLPRHATLAVNLAGSAALFLLQTSEGLRDHHTELARELAAEEGADAPI